MSLILDCIYCSAGALVLPAWAAKAAVSDRHRAGLRERLGFVPALAPDTSRLWIHAASVGEASIVQKLVPAFAEANREWDIVFSSYTNTGRANIEQLYPTCHRFYFPLDFSPCVRRAFRRVRPDLIALVELEVWPHFMATAARSCAPVVIVNGRIRRRSARLYRGLSRLFPHLWAPLALCCARSEEDAANFVLAGVPEDRIVVTGSLKYDALPPKPDPRMLQALRNEFHIAPDAPVLVAGSTWGGEEATLIHAFKSIRADLPGLRLVMVPRHTERGEEVAGLVTRCGLIPLLKTEIDAGKVMPEGSPDEALVVDTVGDLVKFYAMADAVFVGRSLIDPGGGQNMLEPCALGKPVVVGPHTCNFRPEMDYLKRRDALRVVRDADELCGVLRELLLHSRKAADLADRAVRAVRVNVGATERTLARIEPLVRRVR